jgi:hypothetical protein
LCAIFVIGIIINTLINKSFEQYALDRQKKQIAVIIAQVEQQYNAETDATASKPTAAVSALKTVRGKARRLA